MDGATRGSKRARAGLVPVCGLVVLVLAGCGGDGITLPTPTGSGLPSLPSVSVSVPSVSVPLPTVSVPKPSPSSPPSVVVPDSPTPEPTDTPEPTRTPEPTKTPTPTKAPTETPAPTESVVVTATVTPTKEVTRTATATPTATPTPSATVSAAPEPVEAEASGLPAWLWWVLAALAAGVAGFLVVRGRRRSAWDAEVAAAEADVTWLARDLLPQLQQAATPDALAGGWHVSAARVGAVEDRLTGLEAAAPDEGRGARARALRDAVRGARADVEGLIASPDPVAAPVRLAATSATLLEALNPPSPRH